jgi:AGZA family xanthine/uracil permease-like MFS transporter
MMGMLKNFFPHDIDYKIETLAGLSTFVTMAYVLVINATILSEAGMDFGAVMVATILSTVFATLMMGLLTNFPMAIAPGMGVSAYFTFSIVLKQGKTWQQALGAVCIAALILLILNLFKVRQKILTEIPFTLRRAITAGIGLFLICIGLKQTGILMQGKNIVVLGPFLLVESLLTLLGLAVIIVLERFRVRSAYILSILLNWGVALLLGFVKFEGIVALPPTLCPTFLKLDFSHLFQLDFLGILFSIFLVTLLDSSAGLITLAHLGGFVDKRGRIVKAQRALFPDAVGSMLGAVLGTGSLAIHLESAAGIKTGGRTGFVAFVVSLCFLACLFLYPFISTIPHFASAPVLIAIGWLMFKDLFTISWKKWEEMIPALLTVIIMPLTLSIYRGFVVGFISYSLLKLLRGKIKEVHPLCWILSLLFLIHMIFLEV